MNHRTVRRLLLAYVTGLTIAGGGCMKHALAESDERAKPKPVVKRTSAEEDTFEILQGDWMRQHERPYTPPARN
jgi:hypothetical protein